MPRIQWKGLFLEKVTESECDHVESRYVFNAKSRRQTHKVFLKQKLNAVLFSKEEAKAGGHGGWFWETTWK